MKKWTNFITEYIHKFLCANKHQRDELTNIKIREFEHDSYTLYTQS